jgi:hypothetical protein
MPKLPMLLIGADQRELRPSHPKHRTFAPTQKFVLVRQDPVAGEKDRKIVGTSTSRGTSDAGGILTACEAATNQRVNWRACDEGLHYWTGREDL